MPPRKQWGMDKIYAANWSGTLGKVRIRNALIAVGVFAASFYPLTIFTRTLTAKEEGSAQADRDVDFNDAAYLLRSMTRKSMPSGCVGR